MNEWMNMVYNKNQVGRLQVFQSHCVCTDVMRSKDLKKMGDYISSLILKLSSAQITYTNRCNPYSSMLLLLYYVTYCYLDLFCVYYFLPDDGFRKANIATYFF
jgi:hypothetical protein